jgi:hypothetical protein
MKGFVIFVLSILLIAESAFAYYNQNFGRWITRDPLGVVPNAQRPNTSTVISQYKDGMSLAFAH